MQNEHEDKDDTLENWQRAGKLAAETLTYAKTLVKTGANFLEVTERVEQKIRDLGGEPAWPVQMSPNDVAAHQTPKINDPLIFTDEVWCIDIGVNINGCIGDNAATIDLSGKYADLVKASIEALKAAEKTIQLGTEVREIGKAIGETIISHGFVPVRNLSGHGIAQWNIHSEPQIPNYDNHDKTTLEEGDIIAVEPFASTGAGMIEERPSHNQLYNLERTQPVRDPFARKIQHYVVEHFGPLPFCPRWLAKQFPEPVINRGLHILQQSGHLQTHPPLADRNKGIISQAEATFIIGEKVIKITK